MQRTSSGDNEGFTLIEMLFAMAVGLVLIVATLQLFAMASNANLLTKQRAELQQDFRAASNLMLQDISLAGSGLNNQNIPLPSGSGIAPVYGCDQTPKCWINNVSRPYPTQGGVYYLYGLVPGDNAGPTINGNATDAITVAYTDTTLSIKNCYSKIEVDSSGTFAKFTKPATTPTTCTLPPNVTTVQNLNDPVVGLTAGDLLWFQSISACKGGSSSCMSLVEVTGIADQGGGVYRVTFAGGDPLALNQTAATNGLSWFVPTGQANVLATATRILVISYYIDNTTIAGTPRLLRQVSGHRPVPVAENVLWLSFNYNLFDGASSYVYADGGLSAGLSPNQITSVNIAHFAMRSQGRAMSTAQGYQGLDLQTTISGRNLVFTNSYPEH